MIPSSEVKTIIKTNTGPIPVRDFSYFLYLFRAVYVAAIEAQLESGVMKVESKEEINRVVNIVLKKITGLNGIKLTKLSLTELDIKEDLTILDIQRENPLDVVFEGITVAFVVAVIISGGEFELGKLKVKLPSLGSGIEKLRKAFEQKY